ncbi:MAG: NAD(P)H-dependent oxidoreductase [Verrucomicrobiota bacterium]|nr:NAD(P)H-dependent oxidoreductase [Verrucomicrobiota bacterium]
MTCLILSCSLNPNSRSAVMALRLKELLLAKAVSVELIDLREKSLPFCDGGSAYADPRVIELTPKINNAKGILVVAPVYNYDLNAACKNVLELTGEAWNEKVVGFAVTAGGDASYMAPLGFANSLMIDYRCQIIPRYVYATGQQIRDGKIQSQEIAQRLEQLADELYKQLKQRSE